jgi:hypothetical protein
LRNAGTFSTPLKSLVDITDALLAVLPLRLCFLAGSPFFLFAVFRSAAAFFR